MYKKGTVVLVPFPFTDLSFQKIRPAVITSDPRYAEDCVTVVFISSVIPTKLLTTDIMIRDSDKRFGQTGLKRTSVVRCHKIATLDKKIVLGEIGMLDSAMGKNVHKALSALLGL